MKPKADSPTKKQGKPAGQSRKRPEQADKLSVVEKVTKLPGLSRTKSCYSARALTPKSVGRRMSSEGKSSGSCKNSFFCLLAKKCAHNAATPPKSEGGRKSNEASTSGLSKKSVGAGKSKEGKKCAPNAATLGLQERPNIRFPKYRRVDITPMEQEKLRTRLPSILAEYKPGKENQGDPENVKPTADDNSKSDS